MLNKVAHISEYAKFSEFAGIAFYSSSGNVEFLNFYENTSNNA